MRISGNKDLEKPQWNEKEDQKLDYKKQTGK